MTGEKMDVYLAGKNEDGIYPRKLIGEYTRGLYPAIGRDISVKNKKYKIVALFVKEGKTQIVVEK